jgi:hypothetical protein
MVATKAAGEPPVLPRTIEMVVCVVAAGVVSDPAVARSVHVRRFRVAALVGE